MSDKDCPMPYFLKNDKWFYYDEKIEMYNLTDEAPKKAIKSYNEFYAEEIEDGIINKK